MSRPYWVVRFRGLLGSEYYGVADVDGDWSHDKSEATPFHDRHDAYADRDRRRERLRAAGFNESYVRRVHVCIRRPRT